MAPWLSAGLAMLGAAHLTGIVLVPFGRRAGSIVPAVAHLAAGLGAGVLASRWVRASPGTILAWAVVLVVAWVPGAVRRNSFGAAVFAFSSYVAFTVVSLAWGAWFLLALDLSLPTTILMWTAAVLTLIAVPSSVVQTYEAWETLLRQRWRRPRLPRDVDTSRAPRVMIHVPVHAEPPDVVIGTLDRLASLAYPDFSVLVIDNNTEDETLWRPVQDHCHFLGGRFEFVHLMGVEGAKAGALNEALARTPADVELVAVVDADYHVRPDWLHSTVGHFEDPAIAFVQCPHAYRGFHGSRFGRIADTEYRVFFGTSMVSYNERDAALTVGTMSIIRRSVLDDVGGWAEWCLTEDSELSVRIHAAGYSSVYLTEPMGWGLIPETFAAYRRQRFRWTYGPVQELRAHRYLFRPGSGGLSLGQLVHHANHGLDVALISCRFLTVPVTAATALSMVRADEVVAVPLTLWIAATCLVLASSVMRWYVLRDVLGPGVRRLLGSVLAYLSLTFVIQTASLRAVLGLPATWERTPKFRADHHRRAALASAWKELAAGLMLVGCAAAGLVALPQTGMAMMLLLGVAAVGLVYLTAPIVALLADEGIRRSDVDASGPVNDRLPDALTRR